MNEFNLRLKDLRTEHGYSQAKLAEKIGVAAGALAKWESENPKVRTNPKISDVVALANALELSASEKMWLVFGTNLELARVPTEHSYPFGDQSHESRIRWIEEIPDGLGMGKREFIEQGIKVFRTLLEQGSLQNLIEFDKTLGDLNRIYHAYKDAVQLGALRLIHVRRENTLEVQLEQRLSEWATRWRIRPLRSPKVIVADVPEHDGTAMRAEYVAWLAAKEIFGQNNKFPNCIAFGSGYTVWRIAQLSIIGHSSESRSMFIPLICFSNERKQRYSANHIARLMASLHANSEAITLPFVSDVSQDPSWSKAVDELSWTPTAILTVNSANSRYEGGDGDTLSRLRDDDYVNQTGVRDVYSILEEEGRHQQIVGEILCDFFDQNAQSVIKPDEHSPAATKSRMHSVKVSNWRNVLSDIMLRGRVWIVASKAYKQQPILTAMKHGLANAYVIDREIAEWILAQQ